MEKPVYLYYQLDNFYQNHRRYVKSRDAGQLKGESKTVDELDDCYPIKQNKDLGYTTDTTSVLGGTLKPDDPAVPCGLVAKSYFNGKLLKSINFS